VFRGYSVGTIDYVFKPFAPEVLRSKVAAFVELSQKREELQAEIDQRKQAEEKVRRLNQELEHRVSARTAELAAANRRLQAEIAGHHRASQRKDRAGSRRAPGRGSRAAPDRRARPPIASVAACGADPPGSRSGAAAADPGEPAAQRDQVHGAVRVDLAVGRA